MAFLYQKEKDDGELSYEARMLCEAVRDGKSEADAAMQAGVSEAELRMWRRDVVFRAALQRARDEGPRSYIVDPQLMREIEKEVNEERLEGKRRWT